MRLGVYVRVKVSTEQIVTVPGVHDKNLRKNFLLANSRHLSKHLLLRALDDKDALVSDCCINYIGTDN